MKKILLYSSTILLAFWLLGFFLLNLPSVMHTALILSGILFLRSVLDCTEKQPGDKPVLEQ